MKDRPTETSSLLTKSEVHSTTKSSSSFRSYFTFHKKAAANPKQSPNTGPWKVLSEPKASLTWMERLATDIQEALQPNSDKNKASWKKAFKKTLETLKDLLPTKTSAIKNFFWKKDTTQIAAINQKLQEKTQFGKTTLIHLAIRNMPESEDENFKIFFQKLLQQFPQSIDEPDYFNLPPLHWAVSKIKDQHPLSPWVIEKLLEAGAKIDSQDKSQNTALHHATSSANEEAIVILLNKGCPTHIKNTLGVTPLELANKQKNISTVQIFRDHEEKLLTRKDGAESNFNPNPSL